jgi:hypothetical protein
MRRATLRLLWRVPTSDPAIGNLIAGGIAEQISATFKGIA